MASIWPTTVSATKLRDAHRYTSERRNIDRSEVSQNTFEYKLCQGQIEMSGCWLNRDVVFWGWFEAGCEIDFFGSVQDSFLSVRGGFHTEPTRVPVCPGYAGVWQARRLSPAGRRACAWEDPGDC